MPKRLYWALCLFSFFVFSFGLGMTAVLFDFPAYRTVKKAGMAAAAVKEVVVQNNRVPLDLPDVDAVAPMVTTFEDVGHDELILVSGGPNYHRELWPEGCMAWIMDRQGQVHHYWKFMPGVWNQLEEVSQVPGLSELQPIGMQLFPNGEILVNFQCQGCFPFSIGLARFDKDSNLIWKRELHSHHWFSVDENGRIYVPTLELGESPLPVGDTAAIITHPSEPIYQDAITILDPEGNVLEEISMLDALIDSGWEGLLWNWKTEERMTTVNTMDPLHLNDVRVASQRDAERSDVVDAGDLLVSFRNLNAIGILDRQTRRFKWMASGCFVRQHSPRFAEHGVLVFDNLGGAASTGGSRLVLVDYDTQLPTVLFPQPDSQLPGPFASEICGHLNLHPSQSRVLVSVTYQGRIWEVDLERGRVTWEYLYAEPTPAGTSSPGKARLIYTAKYVLQADFPFNVDSIPQELVRQFGQGEPQPVRFPSAGG